MMHPTHHVATQTIEFSPLPAQAPIAPPVVMTVTPEPSATPIPVVKPTDLPSAKPAAKKKR